MSGENNRPSNVTTALVAIIAATITGIFVYFSSDLAAARYVVQATQAAETAVALNPDTQSREIPIIETSIVVVTRVVESTPAKSETAIKEVTREVEVTRPVEVTRLIVETRLIEVTREVTRIVEAAEAPTQEGTSQELGGVIVGAINADGTAATKTTGVYLYPKTLIDAAGQVRGDETKEIFVRPNEQTAIAEIQGLQPGRYIVCFSELSIFVNVGEIEILPGKVKRENLRWPGSISFGDGCDM